MSRQTVKRLNTASSRPQKGVEADTCILWADGELKNHPRIYVGIGA